MCTFGGKNAVFGREELELYDILEQPYLKMQLTSVSCSTYYLIVLALETMRRIAEGMLTECQTWSILCPSNTTDSNMELYFVISYESLLI